MSTQNIDPELLARSGANVLASMCKVRQPGGLVPMRLWPKQREIVSAIQDPQVSEITIVKARQTGVTQIMSLASLDRAIRIAASHSLIVSKGDREAQEAGGRVRQMYASLPEAIKKNHQIHHRNLEVFSLTHPDLPAPRPNEDAVTCDIRNLPSGGGRSYSSDFLVCDEFDHWEDAQKRMADLEPTLAQHGKLVIASTANGWGGPLHQRWIRAQENPRARAIFVSALDRPGRTREWIEERRLSLGHLGPQEFPLDAEEAFISSGQSPFSKEHLDWQIHNVVTAPGGMYEFKDAVAARTPQGQWSVWEVPERGRRYLAAADPAGGGPHSDPSAACIFDTDSGIMVATFHGRPLPHEFALELANAARLYNGALLVPEANNHGQAVIAHLTNLGYHNIYRQQRYTTTKNEERTTLGWLTNHQTKQFAVDAARTQLRERTIGIRDAHTIEELMNFAETQPGRYEARSGHDDRVMAFCIAAAVLSHSPRVRYQESTKSAAPTRELMDPRAGY